MKRIAAVIGLLFVAISGTSYAGNGEHWTALIPGQTYGVKPVETKPFIVLAAARGATLSEPINIGFYVLSSPVCKALANPVDGPATGPVGSVGLVKIDDRDYALDGWCDGGNLTMTPSFWVNRQALLRAVRNDAVLDVWFKDNPPPGFHLHYRTAGFSKVLKDMDVEIPERPVATAPSVPRPEAGHCSRPVARYPIQALRLGQQGATAVAFDVSLDGHPTNLSVKSSSGFPDLDSAAVSAVASAVCNVPGGTQQELTVTFSLSSTR